MGERAKEIDYKKIRGTEELRRIKSVYTRINVMPPVTGSMLAETLDVPEVFASGRFIIVDTKTNGRIGMINPKCSGLQIEYIDLARGEKKFISDNDIKRKTEFFQCMSILDGRGNTREVLGNVAAKAGRGAADFAHGPGKKITEKAWSGTKKLGKGAFDALNWIGSTEEEKNRYRSR